MRKEVLVFFDTNHKKREDTEEKTSFCRNYGCPCKNHFFSYQLFGKCHIDYD